VIQVVTGSSPVILPCGHSSIGRAPGCEPGDAGFDSHWSPQEARGQWCPTGLEIQPAANHGDRSIRLASVNDLVRANKELPVLWAN
jgi:hypothetical protein